MKNRLQRREYERQIKKDKRASICPKCGYKSLFYSTQVPTGEFDVETKEEVIVNFLSILEMVKKNEIVLKQDNNFNKIVILLREGE